MEHLFHFKCFQNSLILTAYTVLTVYVLEINVMFMETGLNWLEFNLFATQGIIPQQKLTDFKGCE